MGIGTGPFVVVGGFAPAGLNVNNNNFDNDNIGVAALRKSCYFPHWNLLKLSGGRTYPAANHPPDFLNHRLNFKVLGIINGSSIFGQSDQHF